MFEELKNKINIIKKEMKSEKDDNKLIYLKKERLTLETEILALKKDEITRQERIKKIKLRKMNDHFKFVLGGLVLRDNPEILKKFSTQNELEKLDFTILKNEADDIKEYFNN